MWENFANYEADDFFSLKFETSDAFETLPKDTCKRKGKEKPKKENSKKNKGLEKK